MWEMAIFLIGILVVASLVLPVVAIAKIITQQKQIARLDTEVKWLQQRVQTLLDASIAQQEASKVAPHSNIAAITTPVTTSPTFEQKITWQSPFATDFNATQPTHQLAKYFFIPAVEKFSFICPSHQIFTNKNVQVIDDSIEIPLQLAETADAEVVASHSIPTQSFQPDITVSPIRHEPVDESSPNIVTSVLASIKQWFFGENFIVRIGAIVLLVGVVLLLKLASQYIQIPMAVRMALIAVAGLVVTGIGYKTSLKRRGYGLTLQGVGFATIYLTVFTSFRLYQLLPSGLTFGLLAILAGLTVMFSVWQNALPLAILAFGGAFLAPILVSQPNGNVVLLFGYYLLLNVAVAVIAHYRTWKLLNALSLAVTFGLAYLWGFGQYTSNTGQVWQPLRWQLLGLLVAHIALYLFIAIRYSQQVVAYNQRQINIIQADNRMVKPLVSLDGGLLFGTALLGFGLIAALLNDLPHHLAVASSAMSAVYLTTGFWLLKQSRQGLANHGEALKAFDNSYQLLIEATLALGVGFLALVLPLALSAKWLTIGWAVQGAALVWLGRRSQRTWTVWFGLALQALTAILLMDFVAIQDTWYEMLDTIGVPHASPMTEFNVTLPLVLLTIGVIISAFILRHGIASSTRKIQDVEATTLLPTQLSYGLAIASAVLLAISVSQVLHQWALKETYQSLGAALAGMMAIVAAQWVHERFNWVAIRQVSRVALPMVMMLWLWVWFAWFEVTARYGGEPDFAYQGLQGLGKGIIGLLTTTAVAKLLGSWLLGRWYREKLNIQYDELTWLFTLLFISSMPLISMPFANDELSAVVTIIPTVISVLALIGWQIMSNRKQAIATASLLSRWAWLQPARLLASSRYVLLAITFFWLVGANYELKGQLLGFYVPLLNPLDLALMAILIYQGYLALMQKKPASQEQPWLIGLFILSAFVTVSSMLVRTFSYFLQTPIWVTGAWQVAEVQTGLTILWSIIATICMFFASKKGYRPIWFAGVSLLTLVVLKLVLVDMSNTSAVLRVVSFIGAGLLMLVIGYLAPLPPNKPEIKNH